MSNDEVLRRVLGANSFLIEVIALHHFRWFEHILYLLVHRSFFRVLFSLAAQG